MKKNIIIYIIMIIKKKKLNVLIYIKMIKFQKLILSLIIMLLHLVDYLVNVNVLNLSILKNFIEIM